MKRSSEGFHIQETGPTTEHVRTHPTGNELRTLNIVPISGYRGNYPFFRQPAELGHFSLDSQRNFHDDNHQLRLFQPPHKIDFDLSVGYNEFVPRNEEKKERLDHLLMWIQAHKVKFKVPQKEARAEENGHAENQRRLSRSSTDHDGRDCILHTDFIAWRGHLTKILCTPYEKREPWQMAATLFNGTIYISEVETEEGQKRRQNMDAKHREMCYWGIKFENYVTVPAFNEEISSRKSSDSANSGITNKGQPINNSECYVSVVRTRLEKHSLVFGAEVDCCTEVKGKPPDNYIELKTSHHPQNTNHRWSMMRYKFIKWWAQSYLAGIPKIICGMRDHNGRVDKLQTYNTMEIPRLVRGESNMWESDICLNFLNKFLEWVKLVVVEDNAEKVYMFEFRDPFMCVTVRDGTTSEAFLPNWFINTF